MTESTTPADRYRRLLGWYPRDHREQHGEEMLDVLLAGAGERARPTRREKVDLLRGALRLHLRRVVGADGGIDHRDVLAIVSLLGPIVVLAGTTQTLDWLRGILGSGSPVTWERAAYEVPNAPVWGIWFVVAVLSLARLRRTAAVGAWLGTAGFLVVPTLGRIYFWHSVAFDIGWLLLGAVVAAALTWSPGPTRGRELVSGARIGMLMAAVVTSMMLVMKSFDTYGVLLFPVWRMAVVQGSTDVILWGWALAVLVAGAMAACGVRTRAGRRAALVLCVPVLVSVVMLLLPRHTHVLLAGMVCVAVPAVVLVGTRSVPHRLSGPKARA